MSCLCAKSPYTITCKCKRLVRPIYEPNFTHNNLSAINIQTHYGLGVMYGIEIEVEVDDKVAVLDSFCIHDYFVVKLDITVPDGLEFVSAPMSFYCHCIQMRKLYDWFDFMNSNGQKRIWASEKTGMHFHIQRNKVSEHNLRWLADFINGNTRNIDIFAGRKENKFCIRTNSITNTIKKYAIRITDDTIELRIFTTFMDYDETIQRLAIINNIVNCP